MVPHQLRVVDTVQLVPLPAAPEEPVSIPLSVLDADRNVLDVDFRTLRLFPSPPLDVDPFDVLQRAFTAALGLFPQVAGSLHDSSVLLSRNHAVPLVLAVSDMRAAEIDADRPDAAALDQLVPADRAGGAGSVLALQATRFACGGVALGMRFAHALSDGAGATKFLAAAARFARQEEQLVAPVWQRQDLLGPRQPPRVLTPFDHVLEPVNDAAEIASNGHHEKLARECFHVSDARVETLRAQLSDEAGIRFTTFEVIVAFIWRARVKANGSSPDELVKMVYSMNISRVLDPALPEGYWGNSCVPVYVALTAGDLVGRPLAEIASLIKKSKRQVDNEYVRSYIDLQQLHRGTGVTAGRALSAFTDWRRLGHSEVDFGWGGPDVVVPLSSELLGSTNPCFLLPYGSTDDRRRRGFKVLVSEVEESLPSLRDEMADILSESLGSNSIHPAVEPPVVVFRSKLPDIEIPIHPSLQAYCFERLAEVASRPCLIDGQTGAVHTYAEVDQLSRRAAAGLRALGVGKGDVVMTILRNCPELVLTFLGTARLGAATTSANPFCTPQEIHRQAAAARPKVIVTEACAVDKVREFAAERGMAVVCVDGSPAFREVLLEAAEPLAADEAVEQDDVVALPYSSGTTGLPKGVMLTHRGLVTSVAQQVDGENPNLHLRKEDVLLCVLPLFHIYALNSVLLPALRAGCAIVTMRKFDLGAMVDLVRRHGVTVAPFVPPIVVEIAKSPSATAADLASIRMVISGAAPMGKDLQDAFMAKIPNAVMGQGYGMTEAGSVIAMCLAFAKDPFEVKSGSCGTVVRNAEVKIVDPESGVSLARNQSGEICIRGQQIMKGYLNNPEATKNTIKDGWLHTGDIGYVDDDDEIFIVDRLKEIIKYKGFQVPPAELEALLITNPEIKDAAVVPLIDELAGEVPVAFVVRVQGSEISETEIKQFVAKEVVYYKRISKVFITDSIPKSPAGKILRKVLREKLAAGIPIGNST